MAWARQRRLTWRPSAPSATGTPCSAPEVTRRVIKQMTRQDAGDAGRPPPLASAGAPGVLTEREREVLALVARGLSNCLAKLHLSDRVQLVVHAYNSGLILPGE